jgi:outer membrane autotransporter protein
LKSSRLGAALSYQNMQIDHHESRSRDELDVLLAGVEGKAYRNGRYLQGLLGYGHLWDDSRRDIQTASLSRQATSNSQADLLFAGMEAGLDNNIGIFTLTPFAGLDYSACFWGGFSEQEAASVNVTIDDTTAESLRSNLGLAVAVPAVLPGGLRLDTRLRLTWSHEFGLEQRRILLKICLFVPVSAMS